MEKHAEWETEAPARYVKRALAETVARAAAPVVVVEGASGVGKTTMAKRDPAFRGFHYVSLSDKGVLAQVRRRPKAWAESLPRPAVIDDVHRAPALVGTIRRLMPKEPGKDAGGKPGKKPAKKAANKPDFVLLSSRALPDEETAAPPPAHFTLFPLTQAEICGREGNIVDDLFGSGVHRYFHRIQARSELRAMMRIGGFPHRVVNPVSVFSERAESPFPFEDRLRLLDDIDFGRDTSIEQLIEKAVLHKIMPNPGMSLGLDAVAQACRVDNATLKGYVERYRDDFFIQCLTELDRKDVPGQPFSKTRVHLIDSALTVEALRLLGHDMLMEAPVFAKVLRTFCMGQLVPAAQCASEPTVCHHWKKVEGRIRRVREVDLVLERGDRIVGVAMRNSRSASPKTIGALRFLAKDERFVRGFIIYMGPAPRQVAENIWALPVSALWEKDAFFEGAVEVAAERVAHAAAAKAAHVVTTAVKAAAEGPAEGAGVAADAAGAAAEGGVAEGAVVADAAGVTTTRATTTTTITTTITTSATVECSVPGGL